MSFGQYPQMRLARAYIPIQEFGTTFSPLEALERGTLFPALFMPYEKRGGQEVSGG